MCAAAAAVALVEYLALRRTQRFSARIWRTIGIGRRSKGARTSEGLYIIAVAAGFGVLVLGLVRR